MKALAIGLLLAAWTCSGFIAAAWFSARDGQRAVARAELAAGLIGAGGFAWAGAAAW